MQLSLSQALLVSQLDGNLNAPYTATFIPLHLSILCLFPTLITRQPANPFWFGVQKNFVELLLAALPFLREYLNVSWNKNTDEAEKLSEISAKIKNKQQRGKVSSKITTLSVVVKDYPPLDIMTPD